MSAWTWRTLHIDGALKDIFALLANLNEKKTEPLLLGLGMDPCGQLIKRGTLSCSMKRYYRELNSIHKFTTARGFRTKMLRIDTRAYHNAGATPTTELACMLSTAAEYLRNSGMNPQQLSDELVLSLPMGRDFAENIAKSRAARMLLTALFSACSIAHTPYIHTQTSHRMLSIYDPWTNMLRNTHAAFAAAASKADSICVLPYDTRLGTSDIGLRVARNTHNILAEECGLDIALDPVKGAHLLEKHTNDLMNTAWDEFQKIEKQGGILDMILDGRIQNRVHEEYKRRRSWISKGKIPIVGTTHFPQKEEKPTIPSIDTKKEEQQIMHYVFSRGEGPTIGGSSVASAIMQLGSGATTFELEEGMFFRGRIEASPVVSRPDTLPFDAIRSKSTKHIPLLLIGPETRWSARAQFVEDVLLSGGIQAQRMTEAQYTSQPAGNLVILCGIDADYSAVVARLRPKTSILLVTPHSNEDVWGLIHNRCDRISLLKCIRMELP